MFKKNLYSDNTAFSSYIVLCVYHYNLCTLILSPFLSVNDSHLLCLVQDLSKIFLSVDSFPFFFPFCVCVCFCFLWFLLLHLHSGTVTQKSRQVTNEVSNTEPAWGNSSVNCSVFIPEGRVCCKCMWEVFWFQNQCCTDFIHILLALLSRKMRHGTKTEYIFQFTSSSFKMIFKREGDNRWRVNKLHHCVL